MLKSWTPSISWSSVRNFPSGASISEVVPTFLEDLYTPALNCVKRSEVFKCNEMKFKLQRVKTHFVSCDSFCSTLHGLIPDWSVISVTELQCSHGTSIPFYQIAISRSIYIARRDIRTRPNQVAVHAD
jgi:hypothetical protein